MNEQTTDPTLWRYPHFYSANHRTHIRNLESEVTKLSEGLVIAVAERNEAVANVCAERDRLITQLEEARWLLETWPRPSVTKDGWLKRRDAWLSAHTPTGKEK